MAGPHEAGLRSRGTEIARPCLPLFVVSPHGPGGCATTTPAHLVSDLVSPAFFSAPACACLVSRCLVSPVGAATQSGSGRQSGKRTGKGTWYRPTRIGGTVRAPSLPCLWVAVFSRVDDSVRAELGTYVVLLAQGRRACWPRGIRQCQHRNTAARISVRPAGRRTDPPGEGDGREGGREGRWRPNPGTERAPRGDWTACRGGRTTQRPRIPSIPACGAVGEVTANGRRRPADAGFLGGFPGPRANLARRPPPPSLRLHAPAMHGG